MVSLTKIKFLDKKKLKKFPSLLVVLAMPPRSRKAPNKPKSSNKPALSKEKPSTRHDEVDISLIQTGKRVRKPRIMDDGFPTTVMEIMALSTVPEGEEEEEEENMEDTFALTSNEDEDVEMSVMSSNSDATVMSEDADIVLKPAMKKKGAGRPKIWYNQGE
ncbi:MAG TPA: hypothetical protein VGO47_09640 [Chlamydiales bacterium]|jgi:hypothetical protein|nr:hypothetical protein [Chlamydiales bacterium]